MRNTLITCPIAALLTVISAQANTLTFTLGQTACSVTCGAAPYGTITLVDNGTGASAFVSVNETLGAHEEFARTGAGDALEFSVLGAIAIGDITSGFDIGPAPDSASSFGSFLASVTCTVCKGGQTTNPPGPLSFTVSSENGVTTDSFIANAKKFFFTSDIVGTTGNTGNVAAMLGLGPDAPAAPEPGTMLLTLSGLALTCAGLISRKRNAACQRPEKMFSSLPAA